MPLSQAERSNRSPPGLSQVPRLRIDTWTPVRPRGRLASSAAWIVFVGGWAAAGGPSPSVAAAANAPAPVPRKPRRLIRPIRSADSSIITLLLTVLRQDDASPCVLAVRRDTQGKLIDAAGLVHGAPRLTRGTTARRTLTTDP